MLAPYQQPELDIVTYLPRRSSMSAVDATSQAIFTGAAEGAPAEQVHIATYGVTHDQLTDRRHDLQMDAPSARILRSVVMKPQSEDAIPGIHAHLESIARTLA